MTCREARTLAPLYLSGEMTDSERQPFEAHLAVCISCAQEIEDHAQLDARIAGAVWNAAPDPAPVGKRVYRQIAAERLGIQRRWAAAAALFALAVLAGYAAWSSYADRVVRTAAARDHHAEVREGKPRRWRVALGEIEALAAQNGYTGAVLQRIAAPGFTLERGKICGMHGERMLHLVYSDGSRQYSVYLRRRFGLASSINLTREGDEHIADLGIGQHHALLVTSGSAEQCESLARYAAGHL